APQSRAKYPAPDELAAKGPAPKCSHYECAPSGQPASRADCPGGSLRPAHRQAKRSAPEEAASSQPSQHPLKVIDTIPATSITAHMRHTKIRRIMRPATRLRHNMIKRRPLSMLRSVRVHRPGAQLARPPVTLIGGAPSRKVDEVKAAALRPEAMLGPELTPPRRRVVLPTLCGVLQGPLRRLRRVALATHIAATTPRIRRSAMASLPPAAILVVAATGISAITASGLAARGARLTVPRHRLRAASTLEALTNGPRKLATGWRAIHGRRAPRTETIATMRARKRVLVESVAILPLPLVMGVAHARHPRGLAASANRAMGHLNLRASKRPHRVGRTKLVRTCLTTNRGFYSICGKVCSPGHLRP